MTKDTRWLTQQLHTCEHGMYLTRTTCLQCAPVAHDQLTAVNADLLAACRAVLGHLDGSTPEIDAVAVLQAAIAKAEAK